MLSFKAMFVYMMFANFGHVTLDVDHKQVFCMAEAIYYEAGNQSFRGKMGVANVITNRAKQKRYGGDVCKVVNARKQFDYHNIKDRKINKANPRAYRSVRDSITIAVVSLEGRLPDVTHGAEYYLNPKTARDLSWMKVYTRTASIEDHAFYIRPRNSRL